MTDATRAADARTGRLRRMLLLPGSLRSRLLIVVLIALLPLFLFNIATGLERQRAVHADAVSKVLDLGHLAAGHYAQALITYRQQVQQLAGLESIRESQQGVCSSVLADVMRKDPTYLALSVVAQDGSVLCAAQGDSAPSSTPFLKDFSLKTMQNGGFTIGSFGTPSGQGTPSLPLGYPLSDRNNGVNSLLFASLNLDSLGAAIPGWTADATGLLVDPTGSPVWRFPAKAEGDAPDPIVLRAVTPSSFEVFDSDGRPQLAGVAGVDPASGLEGFVVVVGIPVSGVLDAGSALLARNLAVLSMAGLLGLIAAWRSGEILIRQQVTHLSKTAQRLTTGDFTARAPVLEREGELSDLARDFNLMAEALQQEDRIAVEMAQLNKELELAEMIQSLLLPRREINLPGLDIAAAYRPCRQLGGDAYNIVEIGSGTVAFVVADVSGHSVSSSLLMTAAQSVTKMLLNERGSTPASVTTRLNTFFQEDLERAGAFFSIFVAFLHSRDLSFTYTNAGHNPPLLWKAGSQSAQWLRPTGPLVGPLEGAQYGEVTLELEEADTLVIYTDGLTEARSQLRKPFGVTRLEQITALATGSGEIVEQLVTEVRQHTAEELTDDVTIVAVRISQRRRAGIQSS